MPEDRIIRTAFGREVVLDVSSTEREYELLMYPISQVFDWDKWQDGFDKHWRGDLHENVRDEFRAFKKQILENFKYYRVPVISLDRSTSKEAVCVVFEKVNTEGKPLDAFELVTAMYAASGHELRRDWYGDDSTKGRHRRLAETLRPAVQTPALSLPCLIPTSFKRCRCFILVTGAGTRNAPANRGRSCPPSSGIAKRC